jgi:crotonobetainyl-CoA:carnitine CoA-transferase CaiB-like acyl-CoA transferase
MPLNLPLKNTRVVEIGTYVAAPALGSMLASLGAEVIKVEPPRGDVMRQVTQWSWVNYNLGKKSVCLDLKQPEGLQVLERLIGVSDIFVESLSPGAAQSLGIGYPRLKKINDKIIYCSIKGFASRSPSGKRPAFDTIAQAEGGLMYVTQGDKSTTPMRVGTPCVDLGTAAFGMINILASLLQKPRKSSFIEVPLFDLVVYWNSYWFPYIGMYGKEPANLGSSHPGFCPYAIFKAKDCFVFLGVLSDKQWLKLVEKLELRRDPSLDRTSIRIQQRNRIENELQEKIIKMSGSDVVRILGEHVPCAKVRSLTDLISDKDLSERGIIRETSYNGQKLKIARPPLNVSSSTSFADTPPAKGQHTTQIMKKLGYSQSKIDAFKKIGAVA